jgi:hypothetical protein
MQILLPLRTSVPVILPVLSLPVLWAIFHKRLCNWRSSFLAACIVWAAYVVTVTELLSAFHAITLAAVLAAWLVGLVVVLVVAARLLGDPRSLWQEQHLPDFSAFEWFVLAGCAFIAAVTALISVVAAPNAFDSLTYHLPKVMHWIADRSVAYYPTHILRQLYLVPGAEYLMLHLHILAGSDWLDALVQWFSMLASAIGVSLISAQLGASRRAQVISAVVAMTIPAGILEATGTRNDYVVALWLVCFVSWMLKLRERWDWLSVVAAGASLGLAVLTKASAYIFALPFLLWFSISIARRHRLRAIGLAVAALVFLLINLPTYMRNLQLFGNPLGITVDGVTRPPQYSWKVSNDFFSPGVLVSNVTRNIGLHLGTPFPAVNTFFERQIVAVHRLIGLSENDPRTSWPGEEFHVLAPKFSEATDGNFLHMVFILASAIIILAHPGRNRIWIFYGLCLLAGFLVFCFYLRWQPVLSRIQLGLFVLYAPILGKAADDLRPRWLGATIPVILLLGALPWLFLNDNRPLVGEKNIFTTDRDSLFFLRDVSQKDGYERAVNFIARASQGQCTEVGVYMDSNDFEYPLWVLLQQQFGRPVSVEAVNVSNISRLAAGNLSQPAPCAIFVTNPPPGRTFRISGKPYIQAWTSDAVSVFVPKH